MDLVIRLRELRARAGLTQQEAAERSGVGAKTLSSFESGNRIDRMKVSQLEHLLDAYGVTLAYFFSDALASELRQGVQSPSESQPAFRFDDLPEPIRASLAAWAERIAAPATPSAHAAAPLPLRLAR